MNAPGLPGYGEYREWCGLSPLPGFSAAPPTELSPTNWALLGQLYRSPDDIDLFAGGLGERPVQGGLTGPTFNCIKAEQFRRLKDGDRCDSTWKEK